MYCLMSEKNNIIFTVFEYSLLLNIVHLCVVRQMQIISSTFIRVNAAIAYHCAVQCYCIWLVTTASVCFTG